MAPHPATPLIFVTPVLRKEHQMHTHSFSAPQAAHALEVVLTLMKERRFFLYRQDSRSFEGDLGHGLDPQVFGPALELDENIRAIYARATREAEGVILGSEQELGLKAPYLGSNKQLVQCNRYTGGLDICRVYPLTAFLDFAPRTREEMEGWEIKRLMKGGSKNDYSPKAMQDLRTEARLNADLVWGSLQTLASEKGQSCVVLLHTRFCPSGGYGHGDFMEGKVDGIVRFSHAMGYLFYLYSQHTRIVRHAHVVFNSSRISHVNVQHWSNGELSLDFSKKDGYNCQVYFPVVL